MFGNTRLRKFALQKKRFSPPDFHIRILPYGRVELLADSKPDEASLSMAEWKSD